MINQFMKRFIFCLISYPFEWCAGEPFECGNSYLNLTPSNIRSKRDATPSPVPPYNTDIYVETAVFVDKDLYNHMMTTFPVNTENELIRFVLAMINAVSLSALKLAQIH